METSSKEEVEGLEEVEHFEDWSEGEEEHFVSLFDGLAFASVQALVDHDRDAHGFDLSQAVKELCDDEISFIKLVNFVRRRVRDSPEGLQADALWEDLRQKGFLSDDQNMIPVLQDDALLYLFEEAFVFEKEEQEEEIAPRRPQQSEDEAIAAALKSIEEMQEKS
eukprot:gene6680-7385_t